MLVWCYRSACMKACLLTSFMPSMECTCMRTGFFFTICHINFCYLCPLCKPEATVLCVMLQSEFLKQQGNVSRGLWLQFEEATEQTFNNKNVFFLVLGAYNSIASNYEQNGAFSKLHGKFSFYFYVFILKVALQRETIVLKKFQGLLLQYKKLIHFKT